MHHIGGMEQAKQKLETLGFEAETPERRKPSNDDTNPAVRDKLLREHLDKISHSDALFVFNEEKNGVSGYVGGSTLVEIAFAYAQNIEIFLLHSASDMSYSDEIYGMRPIELNGKIESIDEYFKSLPKTFVSSKSPIKLLAVSRGMRRAGIRTQVLPRPTQSNVPEQPQTTEETYAGAENRHSNLKLETVAENPAYLATVESGWELIHPKHNNFSSAVVILEKVGGDRKVGIGIELEIPKEMTDKVPSVYPDLGVLAQMEYGSVLKDTIPFYTNGKIDRLQLMENAIFNVAAQLPPETT